SASNARLMGSVSRVASHTGDTPRHRRGTVGLARSALRRAGWAVLVVICLAHPDNKGEPVSRSRPATSQLWRTALWAGIAPGPQRRYLGSSSALISPSSGAGAQDDEPYPQGDHEEPKRQIEETDTSGSQEGVQRVEAERQRLGLGQQIRA